MHARDVVTGLRDDAFVVAEEHPRRRDVVAGTGPVAGSDRFAVRTVGDVTSLDDLGAFADSAFELCRSTFGHAESVEDTVRHMCGDHVAVATDVRSGSVVGLTVLSVSTGASLPSGQLARQDRVTPDTAIAMLQGTVIHPDAQGLGLYRTLNRLRFEPVLERKLGFVSTRTQNPKVERGVRSILDELVADARIASWTLDTETLPGMYGQLLAARQPDIAGTPFEHLDRDAGDTCSLLYSIRYESAP